MRVRVRSLVAASAIAVGILGINAPAAGAMPISGAQSHCHAADGTWSRMYYNGRIIGYQCAHQD